MLKSEEWARDIRREIIEASHDVGRLGVHIGSALSAADVLAVLYADVLNYDVKNPRSEERDYFVLSKGHAYIGYYAALAKAGFFSNQDIKEQFMTDGGWLPVHPVKNLDKGIEFSGAINSRRIQQLQRKGGKHKLPHEKHALRCSYCREN